MALRGKKTGVRFKLPKKAASKKRSVNPLEPASSRSAIVGRVAIVMGVLVACIVPIVFIDNAISYIPLLSAVFAIALSFVYLQVLKRSLRYSEDSLVDSCERNTEIEFIVRFKNTSPLVFVRLEPYFYISDLFGDIDTIIPATMTLMPYEERDFRFNALFEHLGTYSAGVSKIVISDLLGLFRHTIHNPSVHEVKVLPRLFDVTRMDLTNVSVQESRKAFQPIVTDDMDYAGVREYAPGDPLKTIHWKLSSRSTEGVYFTRLFETFGNPGVSIILDPSAPNYDHESLMQVFDGLIESALSLNDYARDCGVDSEIVYNDQYGEAHRVRINQIQEASVLVNDVPRIVVSEGRDSVDLLRREGLSIHSQGNIAFCTAHLNERIVSALLDIKMFDRNPLLFVMVPRALEGAERREFLKPLRRLDAAQVLYYVVSSAEELGQVSE